MSSQCASSHDGNQNIWFIINPNSGRGRDWREYRTAIEQFLRAHHLEGRIALTDAPTHATALAREAVREGAALVVAVGGDGTMNEVAQALVGSASALGLLPKGSGNGLARHLEIPRRLEEALTVLIPGVGRVEPIDTATVNGRFFCNVMGLGFDASITARFNRLKKRGFVRYLGAVALEFRRRRVEPVTIECANRTWSQEALIVAVANSDQYGNNARIAPRASIRDGKLDITVISSVNLVSAAPLAVALFRGTIDRHVSCTSARASRFRITRAESGFIHTDGELHEAEAELEVISHPANLNVIAPRARLTQATGARPQEVARSLSSA